MAARRGFTLVRVAGIPIRFQYSWFLVTAVIVVIFGPQVSRIFPEIGLGAYAVALGYALLLMVSVLAHELAHALSAKVFGWPSTEIELNLWGGHTQFIAHDATPGKSLAVSLAGPASNLVIAGVGWYLIQTLEPSGVTGLLADVTVLVNFLVGLFNLLPGNPLDGGRLVESVVWQITGDQDRGMLAAGWAGRLVVGLVVGFVMWQVLVAGPNTNMVLVVVATMICFFLWQGAGESIRIARARLQRQR
ncbi:site-2 protease family protein [Nesterenkonia cremea]|uniref:Peptidase M50 domain-containing protein n=1 Tax=Nesterenkonia cremea TaxID=1882340 RepID=A0A917AQ85_9MICC|nr:site-2 protease family protein [Nesterenkonia cremea]GGE62605.1 hypothetical protein GCM10011401_07090 [Nesterenkonia cremea]